MAVTYVGETNASDLDSGQSTAALAIAAPAGSATDDLLIAFVHTNNTKGLTLPAGWTTLLRLNFSYLDLWVAYRVKRRVRPRCQYGWWLYLVSGHKWFHRWHADQPLVSDCAGLPQGWQQRRRD